MREGEKPHQEFEIDEEKLVFEDVGADGTKIFEGDLIRIWVHGVVTEKIVVIGTQPERWKTISGPVVEVLNESPDGTVIMVRKQGEDGRLWNSYVKVTIPAKAQVDYSGVGPDGARPQVGYKVVLRLRENSTDTAAEAAFTRPYQTGKDTNGRLKR